MRVDGKCRLTMLSISEFSMDFTNCHRLLSSLTPIAPNTVGNKFGTPEVLNSDTMVFYLPSFC